MTKIATGMAWYRRDDYERVKALSNDPETFPDTFDDWEKRAEEGRKQMIKQGHLIVKAYIDPKTFPQWCRDNGYKIDAKARMNFGASEAHAFATKINKG